MNLGFGKLFTLLYFPAEVINLSLKFDYQHIANDYVLLFIPFNTLYDNKSVQELQYNETFFGSHDIALISTKI